LLEEDETNRRWFGEGMGAEIVEREESNVGFKT
jgi:hypothetical protein